MANELIDMLKRHEGVRSHVYLCSAGYETLGVGRNISESGLGLTEDEIDFLLINDITRVKQELTDAYFWFPALNEARQDAMIDICFNLTVTHSLLTVLASNCITVSAFFSKNDPR